MATAFAYGFLLVKPKKEGRWIHVRPHEGTTRRPWRSRFRGDERVAALGAVRPRGGRGRQPPARPEALGRARTADPLAAMADLPGRGLHRARAPGLSPRSP